MMIRDRLPQIVVRVDMAPHIKQKQTISSTTTSSLCEQAKREVWHGPLQKRFLYIFPVATISSTTTSNLCEQAKSEVWHGPLHKSETTSLRSSDCPWSLLLCSTTRHVRVRL